jgi:hypothetical protein
VRARSTLRVGFGSANPEPNRSPKEGDLIPLPTLPKTYTDDTAPRRAGMTNPPADSFGL